MGIQSFVMKCGGSTLAALPQSFFDDLKDLQDRGVMPVIVHGGGPAISETLERLGIESEFVGGLRKTSGAALEVVEMVLAGRINKEIVRRIQQSGARAIGLSGEDGMLIEAQPMANAAEIGFVGHITNINGALIESISALGYMPVIAPIGISEDGSQHYNINADTAAGAVATHIGASRLIVVTDVPGIMKPDENGVKRVLPSVTVADIEAMIECGDIYGGMIPKVRAAIQCIHGAVEEVVIVHGEEPRALTRVLAGEALGTRILK